MQEVKLPPSCFIKFTKINTMAVGCEWAPLTNKGLIEVWRVFCPVVVIKGLNSYSPSYRFFQSSLVGYHHGIAFSYIDRLIIKKRYKIGGVCIYCDVLQFIPTRSVSIYNDYQIDHKGNKKSSIYNINVILFSQETH